jgi:flavin reductase (DIM6/NTAB) family NADH-FMN oxidoreductase RutF
MKELPLSRAYQFIEPGPVLFLVTSDAGKPNLMTMSAHMVIEDDARPLVACGIGPWDHSFGTLQRTNECVLAIPTAGLAEKVVDIGNCSGADMDKFKAFGLTPKPARVVDVPLVAECLVNLECRVHDWIAQYDLVILEVVHGWTDPAHKDTRLLHHNDNGTFRVDGEELDLRGRMVKWPSYVTR